MSSPKPDQDSDREALTGWTLVDREGTSLDKTTRSSAKKDGDKDSGKSSASPSSLESKKEVTKDKKKKKEKNESGCGTEEEEGEEELSEDLISMGKRVQEIKGESVKAPSGSDSSDIETLDCPDPDDCYEDHTQGYGSLHSSLLSSSLSGFTFVGDAVSDEGDVESLASSDVLVLDQEGKGPEEETDLSLASCPSLPDDLPTIKPDTQYRHTPDPSLNSRLNIVVALTLACVVGLGLGHFVGWSSRSLWQENINSAQVRRLRELQDDLMSCINTLPQEEPESGGPEFLQSTTFIPVLPEIEAEGGANVETFVESLVVPLEEAGVVLEQGQQQHLQQGNMHHSHYRPGHSDSMEPTFATLDLLYGSSDPASPMGQEQEATRHSGLLEPPLTSHIVAEDEIEPTQPQPPVSMKTVEPAFNEEGTSPSIVPQTNTLPPIELDSGLESYLDEEFRLPPLHNAPVPEEEDIYTAPVENSQIIEALNLENEQLRSEIMRLQQQNVSPIKISGKDGKIAREMRERITLLLEDTEELRVAVTKQQFDGLPEGDSKAFNSALATNYRLRLAVSKLIHLVPDIASLKVSANDLQKENQELQTQVGKLRYQEQPLPQELNAVAREMESLKKVVDEASRKKKAPPNFENAKTYLSFMSQVLRSLRDFKDGGLVERLDVATDVFEGLLPGNVKPSASMHHKLNAVRGKFKNLQTSLASKWEKIKDLGRPQHLAQVGQDTLNKMNRVIVNVVNKMKDIGQASIMKRGKASFDTTVATLAQSLAALGDQFDKTWKNLEAEVATDGDEDGSELLDETEEELDEEEGIADDGEEEIEAGEPDNTGDEALETNSGSNEVEKGDGKTSGAGQGGDGGKGGGGGDDKEDFDGKKSGKVSAGKKEDKADGRRDRSRTRMTTKEEKKEEKKEKKAKKQEEKAKKKKNKENKKSKKDKKDEDRKSSEEKENYGYKKKDDRSRKSIQEDDTRHHRKPFNKFDNKQHRYGSDDDDDDEEDDDEFKRKHQKRKQTHGNDDDESDDDHVLKKKYHKKETAEREDDDDDDDDKKKGLMRHWEKPSKKNYRREFPGPKKAFIRRRDN